MTLLINLMCPRGIHQSSDYRLTDVSTRRGIEDEFGSKQVHHVAKTWSAQISFTGIASVGGRKTRDWILEVLGRLAQPEDAATAMAALAAAAAIELRRIPRKDWFLTIVATVTERSREARLFVISCVDRPGMPPLTQPLDHFEVHEVLADRPSELIFGYTQAVSQADRKFLKQLNQRNTEQAEIRRALARINSRSAKLSAGAISEGCLVSSTMPDGSVASENFGMTPGVTVDMAGSPEMLELIAKSQKGKRPVFVQGRAATAENVKELTLQPMDVTAGNTLVVKIPADSGTLFVTDSGGNTFRTVRKPRATIDEDAEWRKLEDGTSAGPSHRIAFSSTSGSYTFNGPNGSKHGSMEFVGIAGECVVAKNRVTKITLGSVTVRALPAFEHQAQAMKTTWDISSQATIDGIQPHSWGYMVDMVVDASGGQISVSKNSVALRSTDLVLLSSLQRSEELVVVSSMRPPLLRISKDQQQVSGVMEARLFLRDIRQPTQLPQKTKASRPILKIGRNSPCPCGSGTKYKKCCLGKPSHSVP
jgi:hypothetical protein